MGCCNRFGFDAEFCGDGDGEGFGGLAVVGFGLEFAEFAKGFG